MELKYRWRSDQLKNDKLFDNPLDCKQNCIDTLQDLTNRGGYPRNFTFYILASIENPDHDTANNISHYGYNYFPIQVWTEFLEPKEQIPPKFRYINYNNEWKVYGNYDESQYIDVYSHFALPTKVQKKKKPRTILRDRTEFDQYIYDIIPAPNTIQNNRIHVNDFRIYQPGEKIKVLDNGKYKTYIVKQPQFIRQLPLNKKNVTPLKDSIISLWYNKNDQHLVDILTPHIHRNNMKIKKSNVNGLMSLTFNPFINDCNVIIYTKNTLTDLELNLKIGKMLTMDLTIYVIFVEVPIRTPLLNPTITVSSTLYPEEIYEIINGIKRKTYLSVYTECIAYLTQYGINDAEILFDSRWKWSPPSLIQLIYNRYNNSFLQKPNILKVIDKTINNNKHVLPKSLYNQVVKHAKLKTVKDINKKKTHNQYLKVESGIHDGMFFYGSYNYQRDELTSHMKYE